MGRRPIGPESDQAPLPPGRPPWDPWNGARVGVIAGGVIGLGAALVTGRTDFLLVPIAGAIGGVVGYRVEKRKQS